MVGAVRFELTTLCSQRIARPFSSTYTGFNRAAFSAAYACRINLGISLYRGDHSGSCHIHLSSLFDDPLECCPDVPLSILKESQIVEEYTDTHAGFGLERATERLEGTASSGCRQRSPSGCFGSY